MSKTNKIIVALLGAVLAVLAWALVIQPELRAYQINQQLQRIEQQQFEEYCAQARAERSNPYLSLPEGCNP